jgi:hypothetical protein
MHSKVDGMINPKVNYEKHIFSIFKKLKCFSAKRNGKCWNMIKYANCKFKLNTLVVNASYTKVWLPAARLWAAGSLFNCPENADSSSRAYPYFSMERGLFK